MPGNETESSRSSATVDAQDGKAATVKREERGRWRRLLDQIAIAKRHGPSPASGKRSYWISTRRCSTACRSVRRAEVHPRAGTSLRGRRQPRSTKIAASASSKSTPSGLWYDGRQAARAPRSTQPALRRGRGRYRETVATWPAASSALISAGPSKKVAPSGGSRSPTGRCDHAESRASRERGRARPRRDPHHIGRHGPTR